MYTSGQRRGGASIIKEDDASSVSLNSSSITGSKPASLIVSRLMSREKDKFSGTIV